MDWLLFYPNEVTDITIQTFPSLQTSFVLVIGKPGERGNYVGDPI